MKNKKKAEQLFLTIFFIIFCALVLIPFLLLISISFSSEKDVIFNGYKMIPGHFSLDAYKFVFRDPGQILQAYKITAIYSFSAMALSVLLQAMIAYPLTRKGLRGRKQISFYLYFTMLFSGGLVPSYILLTQYLHLDDTIWIYIIPGLISPWNVFMMRTFFSELPEEMMESAKIDGANEYTIFFRFVIPLSKPVLATVALNTFLGKWNDWNTSLLYINDTKLYSLQYLLQSIMETINQLQQLGGTFASDLLDNSNLPTETARMAMAVVVTGPAVLIFPFFQKYFVKGMTVGSVKG